MKLYVLADNNTKIDAYFLGEPALSFYIEDNGKKILFDTGYSGVFMKNAKKLGLDLGEIDTIAFSHGHNDHTGGFPFLAKTFDLKKTEVVAHPLCFDPKVDEAEEIGAPFSLQKMKSICSLRLTDRPYQVSENILFLGEIPALYDFEARKGMGLTNHNGEWAVDTLLDDSALVYKSADGLFLITGCCHSGVCNMIEYAKKVCNEDKIAGVIGGFHLFDADERLQKTIDYFEKNRIAQLYPCHCVSFQAKAKINERILIHEVGVGMKLVL